MKLVLLSPAEDLGLVWFAGSIFPPRNMIPGNQIPRKRIPRKVLLTCLVNHGKVTNFQSAYVWLTIHFPRKVMYNSYYALNKN